MEKLRRFVLRCLLRMALADLRVVYKDLEEMQDQKGYIYASLDLLFFDLVLLFGGGVKEFTRVVGGKGADTWDRLCNGETR